MSPEEYITELILNLGEVETLDLVRVIGNETDPPPFQRGEFTPGGVQEWVSRNKDSIVPSILRVVDLGNEGVAYLHRLGVLPIGETFPARSLVFSFPEFASWTADAEKTQTFLLTDVAATSAALCELAQEIRNANYPFGIASDPPAVSLQQGSIQYAVGGSLLASGIGLVVACSTGLVLGPIGFVGGGILASAGIIDLAFGWRKSATENTKLRSEAHKLEAEAQKLRAETRKLEVEAQKLEIEAKDVHEREHLEPIHQYRSPAYSKLIPRDIVRRESESLGLGEGYANHLLNRSLAKFGLLLQRFHRVSGEDNQTRYLAILAFLVEQGVEDPDVELWIGVMSGDHVRVKRALERGADPNVSLGAVISRHRDIIDRKE